MNHNWSARKQRFRLQSVARISRHTALSKDRIRQCVTSSGSCSKNTDQVAISFCRHRSVPVPCGNSSVETTIAEGDHNPVAGFWGRTLGQSWPPEPTSSYAFIDFWCQLVASPATAASWMSVVAMVGWGCQAGLANCYERLQHCWPMQTTAVPDVPPLNLC